MKKIASGLFALLLLAALAVGLAFGVRSGLRWLFEGVDSTVSAAIVAAAATTMVSALGIALGRYFERRHQIEVELRERKIPMYTEFVEGLMKIFNSEDEQEEPAVVEDPEFDMVGFLRAMTPQLMIWASNDVVSKWSVFRRGFQNDPIAYMFMMEELLTAIRKDLGHAGNLPKGHLLGLYINDIDEHVLAPGAG